MRAVMARQRHGDIARPILRHALAHKYCEELFSPTRLRSGQARRSALTGIATLESARTGLPVKVKSLMGDAAHAATEEKPDALFAVAGPL
jgi:hypothetical protein